MPRLGLGQSDTKFGAHNEITGNGSLCGDVAMSFLTSFRSDQLLSRLVAEPNPSSPAALKLVNKLKNSGNKAVPKIIDALALSDKSHTMVLVDILGALVNDKNLDMYREGLADGNERVVSGTAWALSSSTDYNPNNLLDFFDDDEVSKPALIEVLRVHKQDLSVHELLQSAYDCEPKEKAAIFKIIEDTIKPDIVPDLVARMGGKDPVIKIHLMNLLTKFDKPEIDHALELQLNDPNKMVRGAALSAMSARNGNINVEKVANILTDPDLDVQGKAVEVLIKANHPDTVRFLVRALKDESEYARRAAVEVLNEIGTEDSVKDLLGAIKDDDWWVRSRAGDALADIGGPKVVDSVIKLINEEDEDIRRTAIEILNTTKSDRAEDHLIKATDDSDWWVRERAIDALSKMGSTKVLPKLEAMLGKNPKTDTVIIRAFGKLGTAKNIAQIVPMLKRPEREIQVEAIKALSHLASDTHADTVRNMLKKIKQAEDVTIMTPGFRKPSWSKMRGRRKSPRTPRRCWSTMTISRNYCSGPRRRVRLHSWMRMAR
jgi:serine/threonine-protein kinase